MHSVNRESNFFLPKSTSLEIEPALRVALAGCTFCITGRPDAVTIMRCFYYFFQIRRVKFTIEIYWLLAL